MEVTKVEGVSASRSDSGEGWCRIVPYLQHDARHLVRLRYIVLSYLHPIGTIPHYTGRSFVPLQITLNSILLANLSAGYARSCER